MKVKSFEELEIWKLSVEVAVDGYTVTKTELFRKDFSFVDQVRRALVSISSNIAEGFERNNNNELIQYLRIAKGSAGEVRSQLFIALRLGYLEETEYRKIADQLLLLSNMIGKFIVYLSAKRKNHEFKTR